MSKYKLLKKIFGGTPPTIRMPGEIVELEGPGDPHLHEPIGGAPMAPRRYDIPGYEHLSVIRRAEIEATRRPCTDKMAGGDNQFQGRPSTDPK